MKIKTLSSVFTVCSLLLSACSDSKEESTPGIDVIRTPKTEYGRNVGQARDVASKVEHHDKKIKEQAADLFEE